MSTSSYLQLQDEGGSPGEVVKASAPPSHAKRTYGSCDEDNVHAAVGRFNLFIGQIPFKAPNVQDNSSEEDIADYINDHPLVACSLIKGLAGGLCCLSGIGCCYLSSKMILVRQGQLGFSMNNGVPEVLLPGRHWLLSPLNQFIRLVNVGDDIIEVPPISIIRIQQGSLGFATNNGQPEILLPGLHIRKTAAWKFKEQRSLQNNFIEFGPVKFLTVRSGTVQVCYHEGKVIIYPEGRYAVNSATFSVAGLITIQQQNVRFKEHSVLLDGGIGMLVEGLLTYQVTDVERLIKELGDRDLNRSIQDVTKAELARVFSTIHLEQISSNSQLPAPRNDESLLGKDNKEERKEGMQEGQCRTIICSQVIKAIQPYTTPWGVNIINFQLESTKIADRRYAQEYEEASLALAKAKANSRAVETQNQILLQNANAQAQSLKIEAEGIKTSTIIEAEGRAEARRIEAQARNDAAKLMSDDFAKQFALAGQQVEFAGALQATSVTVLPDSAIGKPIASAFVLPASK